MTQEEKAKGYDAAFEYAKSALDKLSDDYVCTHMTKDDIRGMFARMFPDLQETEDEKIRKELVKLVKESPIYFGVRDKNATLAWLENVKNFAEQLDEAYKCADEVQYRKGYTNAINDMENKTGVMNSEYSEDELTEFEYELFSAFSDGWQEYLHGDGLDVAEWAKKHSARLLEVALQYQKPQLT